MPKKGINGSKKVVEYGAISQMRKNEIVYFNDEDDLKIEEPVKKTAKKATGRKAKNNTGNKPKKVPAGKRAKTGKASMNLKVETGEEKGVETKIEVDTESDKEVGEVISIEMTK